MTKHLTRRNVLTAAVATTGVGVASSVQAATPNDFVEINALVPTPEQIFALTQLDHPGPVTMLNLLKFKPDGEAAYEKYMEAVEPLLTKLGAKVVLSQQALICFVGKAEWDRTIIVEWPNIQAFLSMVQSDEYKSIHHYRAAGLEGQVLYVFAKERDEAKS